jgi:ABC-type multidrug transport system ATPase subunit
MPLTLVVRRENTVQEFPIDGPVTIGRSADNQIVLDAANVSRRHAALDATREPFAITDLGSANGTRVRGVEVEPRVPVMLRAGDPFEIGPYLLELSRGPLGGEATMVVPSALGGTVVASETQVAVSRPNPRLLISTPRGTREIPLDRDVINIGRELGNDVVIEEDVVSRRHMLLRRVEGGYRAEDLGARNGIRIGQERITQRMLADGDLLDIAGVVTLRYVVGPPPVAAGQEKSVALADKTELTVGRASSCDVSLNHPTVSLLHARVIKTPGGMLIEDLGSTNGTYVNGQRLRPGIPVAVGPNDDVRVGPIKLTLAAGALAHSDESRQIGLNAVALNQRVNSNLNLLHDISFAIRPNEFVAVVGVSGAGKSTLLGALSGLRPASEGQVLLNGTALYQNFQAFRTTIGYVPQDDILHKELPVGRALEYAAALRLPDDTGSTERRQRVETVISTLGLEQRKATPIARLSGGQRKRVSIGAELLTSPGLFFLDEATSGLDPGTEAQLMRLLRKLADDGHTIVLITHATKNVMLCDQVAFLARGGYLAYYGPPDRALEYFQVPDFDGIYEKLEEESRSPEDWARQYLGSEFYREFVVNRLMSDGIAVGRNGATPIAATAPRAPARPARTASPMRQWAIMARRYLDIIRRDRVAFLLLFILAPAIGLIDLVAWGRDVLDFQSGDVNKAMTMLFLSALFPFLVGALSSVREIVKESPIYTRERAVGLFIVPYLASKILVGALFALYHGAALFLLKILGVDFGSIGGEAFFQIYFTIVLSVLSGVLWALIISALTSKEEQAMLLVIGVVVLQVVFSGGMLPLSDLGVVGKVLGGITSTNWAFRALASAAGIDKAGCDGDFSGCALPGFGADEIAGSPEAAGNQFRGFDDAFGGVLGTDVYMAWAAMAGIMLALCVGLYFLQKRKDTL